jgi:hypothetical protein
MGVSPWVSTTFRSIEIKPKAFQMPKFLNIAKVLQILTALKNQSVSFKYIDSSRHR